MRLYHSKKAEDPVKSQKFKNLFIFLLSILSFGVMASDKDGGVSGGGGNAFVCRENGVIQSVELVDLYEGRQFATPNYENLTGNMDEDIDFLLRKIYPDKRNHTKLINLSNEYYNLINSLTDLPAEAELYPTNDVFLTYKPKNCTLEPVINYYARYSIIINRELYNKMNYVNKVALHLHEILYLKERENGVKDSRYTRQMVAMALNQKSMRSSYALLDYEASHVCETKNASKKSIFYIIPSKFIDFRTDNFKEMFVFEMLNGHNVISFIGLEFNLIDIEKKNLINFNSKNLLFKNFDKSKFFPLFFHRSSLDFYLQGKNGKLYLTFNGEEGDSFSDEEVGCRKIK
jgi:hypothetical protein